MTFPRRRLISCVGCLLLCSISLFSQTQPTVATVPASDGQKKFIRMATAVGDDYFDGRDTRARVRRHMTIAKQLGARYLRCAFSWNGIEPQQGSFQFAFWDMLMAEAEKAGIEVIPYVAYTPEWAAQDKREFWEQPPRNAQLFAQVMKTLASRYRGRIHSWELWNEPDLTEYWQGTADQFAEMVEAGAQAVRAADPTAKIVLGGMSRGPGEFFRTLVERHDIGRFVDVIALHAYPESWHEERAETVFQDGIPEMEVLIESGKKNPVLWLNEMGYSDYRYEPNHASGWGTNVYYSYEHTARYAADFLLKSFLMTAASGDVNLAGWYRIDDFKESDTRMPSDKVHDHLGLESVDGHAKPAFYAFRFFNTLLSQPFRPADSELPVHAKDGSQAVVHSFVRQDGRVVVTGWLRSSEYQEVPVHTGEATDSRRETVSVDLPCIAATTSTYDAVGKRISRSKQANRKLGDIELMGDRVYVAVVECRVAAAQ